MLALAALRSTREGVVRDRGGDLGWLYPGDTVPDFERAMDKLALDEVSQPIRSPFGWHLIQVLERRVVAPDTKQLRDQARAALRERYGASGGPSPIFLP